MRDCLHGPRALSRCAALVLAASFAVGCGGAQRPSESPPLAPATLYPMQVGNAWSYDVDTGDGTAILAISRVASAADGVVEVLTGQTTTRYESRPEGIWRSERGAYLLRAPIATGESWDSGGGLIARITRTDATLDTPAGKFEGCVEVEEHGSTTGATIQTTYCPGIGPALVRSTTALSHSTVRVEARLRGYTVVPGSGSGSAPVEP